MSLSFGAHMSTAGGLHCGIERAVAAGCDCVQIFTKNNNQWNCAELTEQAIEQFAAALRKSGLPPPIAHTSYLINVASPSDELWQKSVDALEVEWCRAERLKLAGLVMHPGAHLTLSPEAGMERVVRAISTVADRLRPKHCRLLLENTAGQGSCLGWQFEQLGWMTGQLDRPAEVGICFDTCHAFAAGYDFSTPAKLKAMWQAFDQHIGLEHLHAIHVNDSKKGLGSRVDRHEHIGQGAIGEEAFRLFVRSSPVKHLPMLLETPKGTDESTGEDLDVQNLATLRRLAQTSRRPPLSSKAN
ncbi:MAG: deoxyribonuclease IV [Aureliella sp.]